MERESLPLQDEDEEITLNLRGVLAFGHLWLKSVLVQLYSKIKERLLGKTTGCLVISA